MGKTIVLVEDEKLIQDLLVRKLLAEGYRVEVADDGEEGLVKIRELQPDLVLLDIILPKKDGMEVLEEMHKDDVLSRIPVIIISNSGQPVEIDRARELGAVDWLVKAEFDPLEVIEKVRQKLGA
ncbi:MAG: response regulator [bacterium]|nr:response regulator [bacterium]